MIVAFQVIVAAPFLEPFGETSVQEYLIKSKLTGEGRNGFAGANELYDFLAADMT